MTSDADAEVVDVGLAARGKEAVVAGDDDQRGVEDAGRLKRGDGLADEGVEALDFEVMIGEVGADEFVVGPARRNFDRGEVDAGGFAGAGIVGRCGSPLPSQKQKGRSAGRIFRKSVKLLAGWPGDGAVGSFCFVGLRLLPTTPVA
ncbi:MAG: hypothetical protein U0992_12900 [Planctomycetaceae bacterium]